MGRLSGKTAIVTGAAQGLGEAFVRIFAEEGAKVVLTDVADGSGIASEIGDAVFFLLQDVTSEEGWIETIAMAEKRFGPVSILVNNAGITSPKVDGDLDKITRAQYENVIQVNQVGVYLGMKHILPSMKRAGGGSIVNISSASGLVGREHTIAYTASKFAVRGMSKVAAIEYGRHNIRVNSVHPGPIETQMLHAPDGSYRPVIQKVMETLPAGRFGDPREIAHMVLLLASDEMRFATGAEFIIDGGMTCE